MATSRPAAARPDGGWRITVAEDSREDPGSLDAEVVAIQHGAVATSSTTVRRWHASDGTTIHHIIDPRTGSPAITPWRTATVVAATCETANAASTAAIVLGDAAAAWLVDAGLPARLVGLGGEVLRLVGWPTPQPDPAGGQLDGRPSAPSNRSDGRPAAL